MLSLADVKHHNVLRLESRARASNSDLLLYETVLPHASLGAELFFPAGLFFFLLEMGCVATDSEWL